MSAALATIPAASTIIARVAVIVGSLALWFWTQRLLARRGTPLDGADSSGIVDGLHLRTARIHHHLLSHPARATSLLISSSLVIDAVGLFIMGAAIFGASIQPFLGLIMLFGLRQICQAFCPLPPPQGMIWRKTGFPTLLVTYDVSNDMFFSGHTAIAVYGAAMLAANYGPIGIAIGLAIALFEIAAVLVLRAHYTMDVFTGAVTALLVHRLAGDWGPAVDRWIGSLSALAHA